jgi:hypothetical protein
LKFLADLRLGLLKPLRLGGDVLVLLHQGGAMRGLGGLAPSGGRVGRVLLDVLLDHQLELHEALAVLALLVHEETIPSNVLELELVADILGGLDKSLVTKWLLIMLDLHVLKNSNDLALIPHRE